MAEYVLPQVQTFQQLTPVNTGSNVRLKAHITGPAAKLIRFPEPNERDLGRLGFYNNTANTSYSWPTKPAGSFVDFSYTQLWCKNALLKYFEDFISGGSSIIKVSGYNNRIRSATINFKTNGSYPRHSSLLSRDVQIGDVAKVRGINEDNEPVTLWTYVKDIVGDPVAAVIGVPVAGNTNAPTQTFSADIEQIAGPVNCVIFSVNGTAYDGRVSGYVDETYDIIVTESSVNGDFTTARLRVVSASGTDDAVNVVPSAAGVPTPIGTRGLTVTFDEDDTSACSLSASLENVTPDDLIAGQTFRVTVSQAVTAVTATSSGTYVGEQSTTYIVQVTRGGLFSSPTKPQITVTTTNGIDISGPTNVVSGSSPTPIGTLGARISFSGTYLIKGDVFYVEATSAGEGPMRTIVLGHNLDTEIPAGNEVDLTLYMLKPELEIKKHQNFSGPVVNWEQTQTELTVKEGILFYDPVWHDGGVLQPLELISEESQGYGELFAHYRLWLSDLADELNWVRNTEELDLLIEGEVHPDNPLKYAVTKALANSNGIPVGITAVSNPDSVASWAEALATAVGQEETYNLVPLTNKREVLELFAAHINSQSSPLEAKFRRGFFALEDIDLIPLVHAGSNVTGHTAATTKDGEIAYGVLEDDPATTGIQYTILRCTSENSDFIKNKVRPGDKVRINYGTDGFGNVTYSEYTVDVVQSEDQLRLVSGPLTALDVPVKFEVWRNLSAAQKAQEIAKQASSWGSRRIHAVWPAKVEASGKIVDGYHLCAALAGLVSGILPQQGVTNAPIVGFTNVISSLKFKESLLNQMAGSGVWIVTQDTTGRIYNRHALTTSDYSDVNEREEMFTRNLDSIAFQMQDIARNYIGRTNATNLTLEKLRLALENLFSELKSPLLENSQVDGQIVDATIVSLRRDSIFRDRFVLVTNFELPYPLNNIMNYMNII
jgi:hypothetical protein